MKRLSKRSSNNPASQPSGNEHDSMFAKACSDVRVAKDILQQHLPQPLQEAFDFSLLELCKDRYIEPDLSQRITDMVYRLQLKNSAKKAYVIVSIEHQSTPAKYMPLRILQYEASIMKQHLQNHGYVPLVYSLVYYNGASPWNYPTDLKALIEAPQELIEQYALKAFQLVELNKISDETLRAHFWSGLLGMVMKHVYDKNVLPMLEGILAELKAAEEQEGHDFVQTLLHYLYKKAEIQDEKKFRALIITHLSEETGRKIMSLAQQHTEQGRQEGRQEGIQQGIQRGERTILLRQLQRRFGILSGHYQKLLDQADDEQLLDWSDRVLEAKTLEDIFKD